MEQNKDLEKKIIEKIIKISTYTDLQNLKISELGKKGRISLLMKSLGNLSIDQDEKKNLGKEYNVLRQNVIKAFEKRFEEISNIEIEEKINTENLDITLPVRSGTFEEEGKIHPISGTIDHIISIFSDFGFSVEIGPDIEDDFNNFTALNIPKEHPARQDHDTFYLKNKNIDDRKLLRTHTSPVQIRTMINTEPPIRIIAPGRTFRCDDDATHSPMFHQVEGLVIDKNINMGHLKGLIKIFCERFFGVKELPVRFRPSYFPFTEPSAEVDIGYSNKNNNIVIGSGSKWLEVMGCGMVHPKVLMNCNLDPNEWQGFAFGLGVERFAMLKYGIADLRNFYAGDIRWLEHYGFSMDNLFSSILTKN
tara:strand:+ start:463 stop:1551 length:1089 start_codon:yes stop_codon:yes gene_type:complete